MGSQRVRHDWATERSWTELITIWGKRSIKLRVRKWSMCCFVLSSYGPSFLSKWNDFLPDSQTKNLRHSWHFSQSISNSCGLCLKKYVWVELPCLLTCISHKHSILINLLLEYQKFCLEFKHHSPISSLISRARQPWSAAWMMILPHWSPYCNLASLQS